MHFLSLSSRNALGSLCLSLSFGACAPKAPQGQVASVDSPSTASIDTASTPIAQPKSQAITLHVAAAEADCAGVGPQTCLLVREDTKSEYAHFYSRIEGFQFVPGFEYVLLVNVTERENVPADASKFRYTLLETVQKTPAGLSLHTAWIPRDAEPDSRATVQFGEDSVAGSGGINRFRAALTVNGTELNMGPIAVTRRAGPAHLMDREQDFFERLEKAASYRIVGEELRLLDAHSRVVMVLKKASTA